MGSALNVTEIGIFGDLAKCKAAIASAYVERKTVFQFSRPSGVFIDKNDTIYVVDSQSNAMLNPGFKRGLRVGSAKDGKVTALVPFVEPDPDKNNNAGMEGVAADAMGNIYVGETTTMILKKYIRGARSN